MTLNDPNSERYKIPIPDKQPAAKAEHKIPNPEKKGPVAKEDHEISRRKGKTATIERPKIPGPHAKTSQDETKRQTEKEIYEDMKDRVSSALEKNKGITIEEISEASDLPREYVKRILGQMASEGTLIQLSESSPLGDPKYITINQYKKRGFIVRALSALSDKVR